MPETPKTERVAVLGLGGGGTRIAAALKRVPAAARLDVAAADTDADALQTAGDITQLVLGKEWTRHQGCGGDDVLGERAAAASADSLRQWIGSARLLFVLTGLGGGAGSGGVKVVARLARENHVPVLCLATLPFSFEGSWRREQAEKSLGPLRELVDAVIPVPNDLLFTTLAADTPAKDAFQMADSLLSEAVAGLARIASAESLIKADLASVRTVLRQQRTTCALGVGHGSGQGRWQQAINSFLASPLLGGDEALTRATAAVVTVLGDSNLTVGEMQTCLAAMERHFTPKTRLVVGAYTDPTLAGAIQITGLVCTYAEAEPPQPIPTAPPADESDQPRQTRKRREAQPTSRQVQGELPLQELSPGVFARATPTTVHGQNLDIPTFQRLGIHLDAG